jgi:hypothetical protein
MNLIDLKKQKNNQDSNYFFKRDALVKNYVISILKLYEYAEVLNNYKPLNKDKLIRIKSYKIYFNSDHEDLAHAKYEALAILDYFENKFKNDFSMSIVTGVKNGQLLMFIADVNLYRHLISVKFVKNKSRVELKGEVSLSKDNQDILEGASFKNIFRPYLIALYPIQLNNKEVLKYGSKIAKKIKHSFIHDVSELGHSEKAKLSSQLNIPYSVSYGLKDINGSTINIYHHKNKKYNRIKLAKLDKELNQINQVKSGKDLTEIIYLCNSSKCRKSSSKLDGLLISPFNQIIDKEVCYVCSKRAAEKLINIRVGERI